ncbi:MAG TPA: hypothetical protein VH394_20885 [Thermoanaerobaculia bacterium]|nr:hypothetical protein [Thermoanaerobaculia bacterium]
MATAHQRLCLKAEVVTWLLLILFCRVLDQDRPFSWRRGALLIGLQVLWANLHGGYPLGIFAVAAYAAGSWMERWRPWRGESSAAPGNERHLLLRMVPLLLFASLIQPSLLHGQVEMLASLLGSTAVRLAGGGGDPLVLEWQPVFPSADLSIRLTWVLLATVGLLSFRVARSRRSWQRLLLFAGLAALAMTAVRHIAGLAIGAAFVIIANLGERAAEPRPEASPSRPLHLAHAASTLALGAYFLTAALGLWLARSGFDNGSARDSFFVLNPGATAPGAADFLLRTRPPGPIFNDFATGGYLTWRLHPHYQLFIDSRILEFRLVTEYKRMISDPSAWKEAESRYGFRTAVLGNFSKTLRSPLGQALRDDPEWRLVFLDPQAAVFVHEPAGTALTGSGAIPAESRFVPFVKTRIPKIAYLASHPFLRQDASLFLTEYLAILGTFGKTQAVEDLASAALLQNPDDPLLLRQRCAARFVRGDLEKAMEDCAAAYRLRDDDVGILTLYALVLGQKGNGTEARRLLDRARELAPEDAQVANAASALR